MATRVHRNKKALHTWPRLCMHTLITDEFAEEWEPDGNRNFWLGSKELKYTSGYTYKGFSLPTYTVYNLVS